MRGGRRADHGAPGGRCEARLGRPQTGFRCGPRSVPSLSHEPPGKLSLQGLRVGAACRHRTHFEKGGKSFSFLSSFPFLSYSLPPPFGENSGLLSSVTGPWVTQRRSAHRFSPGARRDLWAPSQAREWVRCRGWAPRALRPFRGTLPTPHGSGAATCPRPARRFSKLPALAPSAWSYPGLPAAEASFPRGGRAWRVIPRKEPGAQVQRSRDCPPVWTQKLRTLPSTPRLRAPSTAPVLCSAGTGIWLLPCRAEPHDPGW